MASGTDGTENEVTRREEEAVSPTDQTLDALNSKLASLSDRVNLCTAILGDLEELGDFIAKKSLQDVTLPQQK